MKPMNALLLLRNEAYLKIPTSFCTFRAFRSHEDQVCGRGTLHSIAFASRPCRFYEHEHGYALKIIEQLTIPRTNTWLHGSHDP
jgi:hypothetical protein